MQMLHNKSQGILWYAGNPTKTPKVYIYMLLKNNKASRSPDLKLKMDLMAGAIEMQLKAFRYNPQLAGLVYSINPTSSGLLLKFSGYSQKIEEFTLKVLNLIKNIEISGSSFKLYKDKLIQDKKNAQFIEPLEHALQLISVALVENMWAQETLLSSLSPISLPQISKFTKHLLS
ncbi:metalloprotease [Entomophthora muscae]|uniref:Metalloprotease n=1 Tax=Entomophthora muscae TaxID=34485 RepID=A0ACC2USP6_9FUNG|nr:metalloprotease [Entomophthora muscae]